MKSLSAILFFLLSIKLISSEKLQNYLFTSPHFPSSLSKSVKIAAKEQDRIAALLSETRGLAIFLPLNSAWDSKPGAFEAILNEAEGNTRYDLILAASAELSLSVSRSWDSMVKYAESSGGVIDSAYGTPYFTKSDNKVCLAQWNSGQYIEGECATVMVPGIVLEDCVIYPVNKLLLPLDLEDAVENLMPRHL